VSHVYRSDGSFDAPDRARTSKDPSLSADRLNRRTGLNRGTGAPVLLAPHSPSEHERASANWVGAGLRAARASTGHRQSTLVVGGSPT
jgi:hypothetical protein